MKRDKTEMPMRDNPMVRKIKESLDDLGDSWMYAVEFREAYNISEATMTRHLKKFPDHWCFFGRTRIISGDPKTVEHIKENVNV